MGHVLCHDMTQIIKDAYKDARFRKGHVVTEEDIPVLLRMGKENLYVYEMTPGMVHENDAAERLLAVNGQDEVMIATRKGNTAVRKGDKLAGMRVIPLIIEEEKLRRAEEAAGDEPLLQLLPFVKKTACIVTTGSEVKKGLIQDTFTPVVVEKLQAYGIETIAAGVEVTRADITAFGEGGLCLGCGQCHYPICPFGK